MKSLLRLSILTSVVLFAIIACRKNLINEQLPAEQMPADAKVAAAKKWYNESFKKSAEWTNYNSTKNKTEDENRKEPDWRYGIYNKLGDLEIMEFPLSKSNTLIPVPSSLSVADRKRLAAASLTRIAFIKKADNETVVREINYIPDWQYLQEKNFDINGVMYGKAGKDFTGIMVVKKWNDEVLSQRMVEKGRITKSLNLKKTAKTNGQLNSSLANRMACISWDICIEEQVCKEWYLDGNIYKTVCGNWYNTGTCYTQTYCEEVYGGGSGGGSIGDGCNAIYVRLPGDSASGSGVICPCEVYGTCVKTDCAGVENGTAQWDPNCGCIGGNTGRTACPTPCNTFDYRVKSVLNTEGGFINDPQDPGGATNKGISWDTWQSSAKSILGLDPTLQNLQNLTETQAMEIYKTLYWDKVKADQINDGDLRYLIFDFNVNAGANAVRVLQQTLNQLGSNVSVDGGLGLETLTAINSTNKIDLYNAYKINRQAYYNKIVANNPSQSKWINGWTIRVNNFINKSVNFFTDVNC